MLVFALPGLTGGPQSFWTTFFPAILLLGAGMGITAAPLTAAVMGSVSDERAGIASGVNNAVSYTAALLAIAVLGALALGSFSENLALQTAGLELTAEAEQALAVEAQNLGAATVPAGLDQPTSSAVARAIDLAFVETYRQVMLIAAALCFLSALAGALLISKA
jgi:hypothetical protein